MCSVGPSSTQSAHAPRGSGPPSTRQIRANRAGNASCVPYGTAWAWWGYSVARAVERMLEDEGGVALNKGEAVCHDPAKSD
jgi:hypothetical protein